MLSNVNVNNRVLFIGDLNGWIIWRLKEFVVLVRIRNICINFRWVKVCWVFYVCSLNLGVFNCVGCYNYFFGIYCGYGSVGWCLNVCIIIFWWL